MCFDLFQPNQTLVVLLASHEIDWADQGGLKIDLDSLG